MYLASREKECRMERNRKTGISTTALLILLLFLGHSFLLDLKLEENYTVLLGGGSMKSPSITCPFSWRCLFIHPNLRCTCNVLILLITRMSLRLVQIPGERNGILSSGGVWQARCRRHVGVGCTAAAVLGNRHLPCVGCLITQF